MHLYASWCLQKLYSVEYTKAPRSKNYHIVHSGMLRTSSPKPGIDLQGEQGNMIYFYINLGFPIICLRSMTYLC